MERNNFKCHLCDECLGFGCIGEMPGMGGVNDNLNFQLNCLAWDKYADLLNDDYIDEYYIEETELPTVRLAPMTGAVENVGYNSEEQFYFDIIDAAYEAGAKLSIGDGTPDTKLQFGIEAVRRVQEKDRFAQAAVFIKPYSNEKIFERVEWSSPVAECVGIDIDAYNIVTMRKSACLEKKSATQLIELKNKIAVPFALKGVFTEEDLELVKKVLPDIVVVSNHGGRIDTATGSTADFLYQYADFLKNYCGEIWVDGGIRKPADLLVARAMGATEVLIGRPFASALCYGGKSKVRELTNNLTLKFTEPQRLRLSPVVIAQ